MNVHAVEQTTADGVSVDPPRGRARRMPAEERRAMIATAAIPIFIEYGASLTTRELADRLGLAEGTLFRAFGDKDAIIHAVVDAFFEQAQRTLGAGLVDPSLELSEKIRATIVSARTHARGVFAMLSLLEPAEAHRYMAARRGGHFEAAAEVAFALDADAMNIAPERLGALIRLLVIAASAPHMGAGEPLTDDELVEFALYGLAGHPAPEPGVSPTVEERADAARRKD